jgi:outer membrane protein TolC
MRLSRYTCSIFIAATIAVWWPNTMLAADASASTDADPLLLPLAEYTRPEPGQPLPASEAQFDQLLALAATASPTMREQADTVAQVEASRFRSWVRQMPIISASYSLGGYIQANAGGGAVNSLTPGGSFSVQVSRPLYHWGGFTAETALGILKEQIAQNDAVQAYAKLCLDLRSRYLNLVVQKAQATLLANEVDFAARRLDKERILLGQGQSTSAKVSDLDLESQSFALKKSEADSVFKYDLAEFCRLTGSHSFSADDVPDHIYMPVVDETALQSQYQQFQQGGFDHSPTASGAQLNQDALEQQIRINRANQRPQFNLAASASEEPYINSSGTGLKFGTIFFAGINGSWLLYDRDEALSRTNALLAQQRVAETKLQDTREQTFNDSANDLDQIDLGLRALAVLKRQLAEQQADYGRIQVLESTGQTEITAVDTARSTLLNTRFEILQRQVQVANGYYSYLSELFRDPALANLPPFTQPR